MIALCTFYALIPHLLLPTVLAVQREKGNGLAGFAVTLVVFAAIVILPLITAKNWLIMIIAVIIVAGINMIIIAKGNTFGARTALLVVNVLVCVVVYANDTWFKGFNPGTASLVHGAVTTNVLVRSISPQAFSNAIMTISGLIFVSIELNNPIALVLKRSQLMPKPAEAVTASSRGEPGRGRVIGYLERSLVFLLVITGNFSAIGLVLAAKAFARFRQLDDRDFAEYVLIGTLLSIGTTVPIGLVMAAFLV